MYDWCERTANSGCKTPRSPQNLRLSHQADRRTLRRDQPSEPANTQVRIGRSLCLLEEIDSMVTLKRRVWLETIPQPLLL